MVDAVGGLTEEAFVVLLILLICAFGVRLEKRQKEVRRVCRCYRWFWDKGWHVGSQNRACGDVVPHDEVLW